MARCWYTATNASTRKWQKTSIEGGTLIARLTQVAAPNAEAAKKDDTISNASDGKSTANVLSVDDTAWATLAARKPQHVLLVTEGNLFLQKVFEANPLVK